MPTISKKVNWSRIKSDYVNSRMSTADIAKKYNLPYGRVRQVCAKEKWVELRNNNISSVEHLVESALIDEEVERRLKIERACLLTLENIINKTIDGCYGADGRDNRDNMIALKEIRSMLGIKSETEKQETQARIEALRAKVEEAKRADAPKEVKISIVNKDGDDFTV